MDRDRSRRTLLALLLLTLLALLPASLLSAFSFFQRLEQRTVDVRFRNLPEAQSVASSEIVVVEIDEASIENLEPALGRWPWPREAHAVLLNYLSAAGARLVVFDLQFRERDLQNPDSDESFIEATREAGNVIHALVPLDQSTGAEPVPRQVVERNSIAASGDFVEFPQQLDTPFDGLWQAAHSLGHVAIILDPDGPMRRHLLMIEHAGRIYPSLSLAAALAVQGLSPAAIQVGDHDLRAGDMRVPLDQDWRLPIWYNGGAGAYSPRWEKEGRQFRGYNYGQIIFSQVQLGEGEEPLLAPELFRDKIVLVGLTAEGLHELFTTPFSGGSDEAGARLGKMAGVEIHANVLDDLLHNRYLRPTPGWLDALLMAALAAAAVAAVLYARLWLAGLLSVVAGAGYLWIAQLVFAQRLQLPVVPVVLSWAGALGLSLSYQYWIVGRETRAVKQTFSRFVSRDVYQRLIDDPRAAELGGRRTVVTVLFSDLRGFTSMSEGRQPEEIVSQLNEYFSAMVEIVFAHRGTVDKFVGDMIMALFNTPLSDPKHADHAVQCAVQMNRKLQEMNQKWKAEGKPELAQGIGLNSGEMVAGVVGAETVRSYTVIGDNVNLGARLESLCKQYKAEIIISEFTLALLQEEYPMQELGDVLVKGKSKPIKIHQVFYREDAVSLPPLEQAGVMVQTQK